MNIKEELEQLNNISDNSIQKTKFDNLKERIHNLPEDERVVFQKDLEIYSDDFMDKLEKELKGIHEQLEVSKNA